MSDKNCVLILSDEDDISTNDVLDWIDFFGGNVLRINESTKIDFLSYQQTNSSNLDWVINVEGKELKRSEITCFWYRRGVMVFDYNFIETGDKLLDENFNKYLGREITSLNVALNKNLNQVSDKVGCIFDNEINKLEVLNLASSNGLDIPKTLITSSKKELFKFIDSNEFVITKAISEGISFKYWSKKIDGFTNKVEKNNLIPDRFFPTLFQEGLSKKWEIRAFYINEKIFSTAIFSQNDENTKIDFRHYGTKYPNRTPPIKLPEKVENSIKSLMRELKMQSGSIDIVYTADNRYVFLEVNPVGQFAQVSDPGNFCLEKVIAKELLKNEVKKN